MSLVKNRTGKAAIPLHKMSYLVVDDFPSARKSVRSMLGQVGVDNIFEAGTALQAKKLLKDRHFDIVICDFNLGTGQDGQQLLEEMRTTRAITHLMQWVIITAETSKEMVMGAVEFQPDDYLAKPFAFDTFKLRLDKWVRRINELAPMLKALDQADPEAIIAAAQAVIDHQPRYRAWARKMLVSTWIESGELDTAETYLNEIMQKRQQDWALFDLARIHMQRRKFTKASVMLQEVISTNPNHIGAYDHLAQCYLGLKQPEKAQQILLQGVRLSPRNLQRQRHLADISRDLHDYLIATRAYKEVLTLATHSRHESPEHFVNLAETLNIAARHGLDQDLKNAAQQALQTAQRMGQQYSEQIPLQLKSRMLQSEALDIQGLASARDGELKKIHELAMRDVENIETSLGLDIAETLYRFEKQTEGDEWIEALRKQHADNADFQQQLLLAQSEPVSERARRRAAEQNQAGNAAYKANDYNGALEHFNKALSYSPRHPGLVLNIAQAHLKLHRSSQDPAHVHHMHTFLQRLNYLPENHYQYERYQALVKLYNALQEEQAP